ncbi:MAG TPA: RNA-binding protein [Xanthobacteraceae bacterium]|jgi:hypothetical protein
MIAQIGDETLADELDRGSDRRQLSRLCAATHTVRPVADLVRFVVGPVGEAVPDVKNKLPGRGIWITATRDALEEAIRRKLFARGFKRDVRLPADLVARTEMSLERAAVDALAIAGKAGAALTGFVKVETALEKGEAIALLHAAEASADGKRKLAAARARQQPDRQPPVITFFTAAQLDLALQRPNVVHAAVLAGPASETFLARCQRLERFRTGDQCNQGQGAARTQPAENAGAYGNGRE